MEGLILVNTAYFDFDNAIPVRIDTQTLLVDNTEEELNDLVNSINVWDALGKVFKSSISNSPYFVQIGEFDSADTFLLQVQLNLTTLNEFFNFLWFVKDCSACVKQSGGNLDFGPTADPFAYIVGEGDNYSRADGTSSNELFTADDLREAHRMLEAYSNVNPIPKSYDSEYRFDAKYSKIEFRADHEYHELNRVQRSYRFLKLARSTKELPLKISFYVLIIESLFSANDQNEVSHKVAERASLYIRNTSMEKLNTFKFLKKCYNVRSKYIHGQRLDPKDHTRVKLMQISFELDILVREILTKVIMVDSNIFLLDQNSLESWLNNLVFN